MEVMQSLKNMSLEELDIHRTEIMARWEDNQKRYS